MSSGSNDDKATDDEFDLEAEPIQDVQIIHQRLKEFCYYLVENVEFNLNFCLQLLEERPVGPKPNSLHVTALGMLCSAIPHLPGGLGNALKNGETTIFRRIEKKNSKTLADLVYYYSDNKALLRNTIIDAAVEVFSSFENQFLKLTCNGGAKRAMQKLAIDASDRIFNYFLITKQNGEVTTKEFIKGIIEGDSKRNKKFIKEGKQVSKDNTKWKTCKLYSKVGIVIIEPHTKLFFKTDNTKPEKYGYRKIFTWENPDDIKKNWTLQDCQESSTYSLDISDDLIANVKDYIMTKNPHEEAKLERRKFDEEAKNDREEKLKEILNFLKQQFNQFWDGLNILIEKAIANTEGTSTLLETVTKNQEEDNKKHSEIITKLEEVHVDIKDTKEKQEVLVTTSETIKNEIVEIKSNQEEMAIAVVTHDEIEEIVKRKAKESTIDGLKEFISESIQKIKPNVDRKEDLNPKIKKTLERVNSNIKRGVETSKPKISETLEKVDCNIQKGLETSKSKIDEQLKRTEKSLKNFFKR